MRDRIRHHNCGEIGFLRDQAWRLQHVHRCSYNGTILVHANVGADRRAINRSNTEANGGTNEQQPKPSAESSTNRRTDLKCPLCSADLLTVDGTVRSAKHTRPICRSKQPANTFTYSIPEIGPLHIAVPSADNASQRGPDGPAKPESDDGTVSKPFSLTDSNHLLRGPGCRWRCSGLLWRSASVSYAKRGAPGSDQRLPP